MWPFFTPLFFMGLPVKIGILSFTSLNQKKENIGNIMLQKAARDCGYKVRVYRHAHFQFTFDPNHPSLQYKNEPFAPPDVMIVRASVLTNVDSEVTIVKQLQLMGIPVINHYLPIVRAKNKVATMQILSHKGIPIPKTAVIHHVDNIDAAVQTIGRFPLIIKMPQGSEGIGVSILESSRSLRSMLDLMENNFRNNLIIVQEYVKEAKGKDIRVFIVGGKIVAAMERKAKRGEFRSNFERGGSVSITDLSEEEKDISLQAAKAIGLDVAGVDVIRTVEGPKILEVNANPGLEGITQATGINVAQHILMYAEKVGRQKRWLLIEKKEVAVESV